MSLRTNVASLEKSNLFFRFIKRGQFFSSVSVSKSVNARYFNAFLRKNKGNKSGLNSAMDLFGAHFLLGPFLDKRPNIRPNCSAARKEFPDQGVTKRCRLSWLTKSAVIYESKCRGKGGGGVGSQPISTVVHKSPNKLKFRAVVFDSQSKRRFK
jgi:hypothetical protein